MHNRCGQQMRSIALMNVKLNIQYKILQYIVTSNQRKVNEKEVGWHGR